MTPEGLRTLLHLTARTTFVFFVGAFSGNALPDLRLGAISVWLARQRDWFLLATAVSHTFHLAAIIAFFHVVGWSHLRMATLIGGGSVYLLIYGLAIVAFLRLRKRKEMFLFGKLKFEALAMYLIWLIFALAFVPRMLSGWPVYSLLGFAALAALVVRIACLVRHRHRRANTATA